MVYLNVSTISDMFYFTTEWCSTLHHITKNNFYLKLMLMYRLFNV